MSERALQAIIGHAIVDRGFRHELMNGGRERLLADFDLTEAERDVVRSIQAQTFEEFASELHSWIVQTRHSSLIRPRLHLSTRTLGMTMPR